MGNFLAEIKGMLADNVTGALSSKRVITASSALMLFIAFGANVFQGKHIDDNILNAIMFVILGGMGFSGMEKFAPNPNAPPSN
jgi:hypothetical protein